MRKVNTINKTSKLNQSKAISLNKDFIQANAIISDKAQIIPNEIYQLNIQQNDNNTKQEQVIYNSKVLLDNPKVHKGEGVVVSGSHYNNIVLEPGVKLKEEEKSKGGIKSSTNQFGRMSVREYEQMRNNIMRSNTTNEKELSRIIKSQYDRDYIREHDNNSLGKFGQIANKNIVNGNTIQHVSITKNINPHFIGAKLTNFNWQLEEKNDITKRGDSEPMIMNEDLFKNRKTVDMKKKQYLSSNQNYVNNFNNQIIQNNNWGLSHHNNQLQLQMQNPQVSGLSSTMNTKRTSDLNNMRTRKRK